jgi:iron complex transport system substrate-binding protein
VAEPRIVSLLPSTTEIACALGFRDALVGRSHECDHPPGVESLPACTAPRFDDGRSGEIDDRVKDLVRRGLSVYDVDTERLRALRPTHVLTQDQCEVCAASLKDVEAALCDWTGSRPAVVSLEPSTLGDVWDDVGRVALALGVPDRGRALASELASRVADVGERTGSLASRPAVACIEWLDPLMGAGHWMPELVRLAGGRPCFGSPGEPSPWIGWEDLDEADPDAIVLLPCGFDRARTRKELPAVSERPEWRALRAVREGRVYVADGNAYFNRPGPRLVESLEILAEILHPDRFDFGHEGTGWERWGG